MKKKIRILLTLLIFLTTFTLQNPLKGYAEDQEAMSAEQAPADMSVSSDESPASDGTEDSGDSGVTSLGLALITYDQDSVTIDYSKSVTLAAMASSENDAISWSSSDENVAIVSANSDGSATVTGVGEGMATIACSVGEQVRTFIVTVNPPKTLQITNVEYPSALQLSNGGWSLGEGMIASADDLKMLTSSIRKATEKILGEPYTVVFDGGVKSCKVNELDEHVPFSEISKKGTYIWTLEVTDVRGRYVSVDLPIRAVESGDTVVSSVPERCAPIITLPNTSNAVSAIALKAGETKQMAVEQLSDGITGGLIWISYDPTVAVVSPDGVITGVGAGSTTVVCRALDNSAFSAGCTVTVQGSTVVADDLSIEGRNYIQGTGTMTGWIMRGPSSVINSEDGVAVLDWQANPVLDWNGVDTAPIKYSLLRGKEITVSLDVRSDDANLIDNALRENGGGFMAEINIGTETEPRKHWVFLNQISFPSLSKQWQRISETLTLTDDVFTGILDPDYVISDDSYISLALTNRSIYRMQIRKLKVELGNMATDWTPAPEDGA